MGYAPTGLVESADARKRGGGFVPGFQAHDCAGERRIGIAVQAARIVTCHHERRAGNGQRGRNEREVVVRRSKRPNGAGNRESSCRAAGACGSVAIRRSADHCNGFIVQEPGNDIGKSRIRIAINFCGVLRRHRQGGLVYRKSGSAGARRKLVIPGKAHAQCANIRAGIDGNTALDQAHIWQRGHARSVGQRSANCKAVDGKGDGPVGDGCAVQGPLQCQL